MLNNVLPLRTKGEIGCFFNKRGSQMQESSCCVNVTCPERSGCVFNLGYVFIDHSNNKEIRLFKIEWPFTTQNTGSSVSSNLKTLEAAFLLISSLFHSLTFYVAKTWESVISNYILWVSVLGWKFIDMVEPFLVTFYSSRVAGANMHNLQIANIKLAHNIVFPNS